MKTFRFYDMRSLHIPLLPNNIASLRNFYAITLIEYSLSR